MLAADAEVLRIRIRRDSVLAATLHPPLSRATNQLRSIGQALPHSRLPAWPIAENPAAVGSVVGGMRSGHCAGEARGDIGTQNAVDAARLPVGGASEPVVVKLLLA